MWMFSNVCICAHTHIHAHTHTHIQSCKMASSTYNRSRGSKPVCLFRPRRAASDYTAPAWTLKATLLSFWSLDTLATYFHFTMSACHVFPTDLMLQSVNLKYTASPIKLGLAYKVDPLCFLFSDISQPVGWAHLLLLSLSFPWGLSWFAVGKTSCIY